MQRHRALLAGFLVTAIGVGCSGSTGPNGLDGTVFETLLSADSAHIGDRIGVTLAIQNPTANPITLVIGAGGTIPSFSRGDTTDTYNAEPPTADTMTIQPYSQTTLAPAIVQFYLPPAPGSSNSIGYLPVYLAPGTLSVSACADIPNGQPSGYTPKCGKSVPFLLLP
jgi:hypothetical protein